MLCTCCAISYANCIFPTIFKQTEILYYHIFNRTYYSAVLLICKLACFNHLICDSYFQSGLYFCILFLSSFLKGHSYLIIIII